MDMMDTELNYANKNNTFLLIHKQTIETNQMFPCRVQLHG